MSGAVSVIVPTYNRADLIARTLTSVLAQSVVPAEVIVVDDGSSDDTEAVVARFAPRVRYVRTANGGVASARNHGATLASGDWLAFTDSDDLWHPRKLEVQLAGLARVPGARWSVTGCDIIDPDDKPFPGPQGWLGVYGVFRAEGLQPGEFFSGYLDPFEIRLQDDTWPAWHGDAWEALFLGNFGLPSSAVVEAAFFRQLGGFNPAFRLAEETEFFHRAAAAAPLVLIDAPLVSYRRGLGGSLVSAANASRLIENALQSVDGAAKLRSRPGPRATANWQRGRRRLLEKLAWVHLTNLAGPEARRAQQRAWAAGAPYSLRSLGLYAASAAPTSVLAAAAGLKRKLRG